MPKISKEDFFELFKNFEFADDDAEGGKSGNAGSQPEPKQERKQEQKAEYEAELEAAKAELARLKSKEAEAEARAAESKAEEKRKSELEELNKKIAQQENKAIESAVGNHLSKKDFDPEVASEILKFVKYDSLKKSNGEVDEEKVTQLVDAVTGLSLRNPPKVRRKPQDFSTKSQGMGKYLTD